jgi:hypothetical protein
LDFDWCTGGFAHPTQQRLSFAATNAGYQNERPAKQLIIDLL